jgi:hypothetical protein
MNILENGIESACTLAVLVLLLMCGIQIVSAIVERKK